MLISSTKRRELPLRARRKLRDTAACILEHPCFENARVCIVLRKPLILRRISGAIEDERVPLFLLFAAGEARTANKKVVWVLHVHLLYQGESSERGQIEVGGVLPAFLGLCFHRNLFNPRRDNDVEC
jgi:hypothetical protein